MIELGIVKVDGQLCNLPRPNFSHFPLGSHVSPNDELRALYIAAFLGIWMGHRSTELIVSQILN